MSWFWLRYGSRTIDLLKRYYQNELTDLSLDDAPEPSQPSAESESRAYSSRHTSTSGRTGTAADPSTPASSNGGSTPLHDETLAPRSALPPLLLNLGERPPEALQYLGTSFGLTQQLFSFWHRSGYKPVYVRQTASDITGELWYLHWAAKRESLQYLHGVLVSSLVTQYGHDITAITATGIHAERLVCFCGDLLNAYGAM